MKIMVRSDGFEGWAKRGRIRAERLARGEKIPAIKTITFDSPLEMLEMLTVERVRLCEVARTQVFSVTALAAALIEIQNLFGATYKSLNEPAFCERLSRSIRVTDALKSSYQPPRKLN